MSYIGKTPTSVPLTSSDITDGIITTAKIADSSVTTEKIVADTNFRNIIINGDMSIAQRGTSFTSVSNTAYHLDRFQLYMQNESSVYTVTQSTETPTGQGFSNSMKLDVTTADTSVASNEEVKLVHKIEAQNLQYLKYNTSSAESLTLSFWVKTNKTGTYIARMYAQDGNRDISASYTVSDSNWNKYTITFPGDTSGTINNDNGRGIDLQFWLVAGSAVQGGTLNTSWRANADASSATGQVNLADSTSNEWYITGVQLEVGTTASDFEFLPVDVNLERCQRYYQVLADGTEHATANLCTAGQYSNDHAYGVIRFLTIMRAAPSMEQVTGSDYYRFRSGGGNYNGTLSLGISTPRSFRLGLNRTQADIPANAGGWIGISGASTAAKVAVTSEL